MSNNYYEDIRKQVDVEIELHRLAEIGRAIEYLSNNEIGYGKIHFNIEICNDRTGKIYRCIDEIMTFYRDHINRI